MWAAGIMPVSVTPEGVPVVLLGRDAISKGGAWSDFCGGSERIDAGPHDTALREFWEETAGAMRLPDLQHAILFRDRTPSGKELLRYVARVPFDPAVTERFDPDKCKNREKVELRWFELCRLPPMRRMFAAQMRRDAERIALFALENYGGAAPDRARGSPAEPVQDKRW